MSSKSASENLPKISNKKAEMCFVVINNISAKRNSKKKAKLQREDAKFRIIAAGLIVLSTWLLSLTFLLAAVREGISLYELQNEKLNSSFSQAKFADNLLAEMDLVDSKIVEQIDVINSILKSNKNNINSDEIQFETVKVSELKERVKRFACWHNCIGEGRKRATRAHYNLRSLKPLKSEEGELAQQKKIGVSKGHVKVTEIKENLLKSESDSSFAESTKAKPYDTNQLTDNVETEKPRRKKSPELPEFNRDKSNRIEGDGDSNPNPSTEPESKPVPKIEKVLQVEIKKVAVESESGSSEDDAESKSGSFEGDHENKSTDKTDVSGSSESDDAGSEFGEGSDENESNAAD